MPVTSPAKQNTAEERNTMKILKEPVRLKDAMANFSPRSGASDEYCKGLIVGVVSALMATGMTWRNAIAHAANSMPSDARMQNGASVPESWVGSLHAEFMASHKNT